MTAELIREWIVTILQERIGLLGIAMRQRAKFEGWLKFELADFAQKYGAVDVQVELPLSGEGYKRCRSDVTFYLDGARYDVELKTANTSWRTYGVAAKSRTTTENFEKIVEDGKKLRACSERGVVAFVIFPVPTNDTRWEEYIFLIASKLTLSLSVQAHTSRLSVILGDGHTADVIVCAIDVSNTSLPGKNIETTK